MMYIAQDFWTPNHIVESDLVAFVNAYRTNICVVPEQNSVECANFPAVRR